MPKPPTDPEINLTSPDIPDPPPKLRPLGVRSFGMTDRGRVRESNEDQFLVAVLTKDLGIQQSSLPHTPAAQADDQGHIFLVADGIGGSPAGKEASALAVKSIEEFLVHTFKWFFQLKGLEKENVVAEFQDALRRADARIFREVEQNPQLEGMGTTLTLAYSLGTSLFVASAGDSRCYLFRHGRLNQLTTDHTLAQDMVRRGLIPPTDRERIIHGHLITNAIGGPTQGVWAEVHKATLEPGDVVLVATDGLTNAVPDETIASTLAALPDPRTACERLVAQALEQGGPDNVTVIVARYEEFTG